MNYRLKMFFFINYQNWINKIKKILTIKKFQINNSLLTISYQYIYLNFTIKIV